MYKYLNKTTYQTKKKNFKTIIYKNEILLITEDVYIGHYSLPNNDTNGVGNLELYLN